MSVTTPPQGRTIEQHVGDDQADQYEELPDEVDVGWRQHPLDDDWLPPADPTPSS